jgi:hypothetical protein
VTVLAVVARRVTQKARLIVSGVGAGITVFTASGDMNQLAGPGLYLTLAGGMAWFAAVVWEHNETRRL